MSSDPRPFSGEWNYHYPFISYVGKGPLLQKVGKSGRQKYINSIKHFHNACV